VLVIALPSPAADAAIMARAPQDYDLPLELMMVRRSELRAAEALAAPARRVTRARGRRSVSAFSGLATFVALLVTDLTSDGISIEGVGTWIAATVIVWVGALHAIFIPRYLGLKKYFEKK
jgi:hypothetical protein